MVKKFIERGNLKIVLNFYYWYAGIFSALLFLYNLNWSDMNTKLDSALLIFLIATIIISLLLGIANRRRFIFVKLEDYKKKNSIVLYFIIAFNIINFLYEMQIPLISIMLGSSRYKDFYGIPTLHALIGIFSTFYAAYIFYLFVCFPKRKSLLIEFIILFFMQLLYFNRGGMIIYLFIAGIITFASLRKKIVLKHIFIISIGILIFLFFFGILGNLRSGFKWNDNSFIERIAFFNDKYPTWLPKEYMWAYSYITSPLSNLNHNIVNHVNEINFKNYLSTFIPDFIGRRLYIADANSLKPKLITVNFNAVLGYTSSYLYGGIIGMYMMYIYIFAGSSIILRIVKPIKSYFVPAVAIINLAVVFLFFSNTLSASVFSFPLAFPVIAIILKIYPKYRCYSVSGEKTNALFRYLDKLNMHL